MSLDDNNFGKFSHVKIEIHIRLPSRQTYEVGSRIYESGFRRERRASRESSAYKFKL